MKTSGVTSFDRCFHIAGERPKDQEGILQRQELQEAHSTQGHTVQDWQSQLVRSRFGLDTCTQHLLVSQPIVQHTNIIGVIFCR